MSSRCYNYFTWKAGRGNSERVRETGERKRKIVPTRHSASCCRGVVERFIDHLRMHSVKVDKVVERHEGDRGRERSRPT